MSLHTGPVLQASSLAFINRGCSYSLIPRYGSWMLLFPGSKEDSYSPSRRQNLLVLGFLSSSVSFSLEFFLENCGVKEKPLKVYRTHTLMLTHREK